MNSFISAVLQAAALNSTSLPRYKLVLCQELGLRKPLTQSEACINLQVKLEDPALETFPAGVEKVTPWRSFPGNISGCTGEDGKCLCKEQCH